LTEKFGGATSFVRAPGQGLWRSDGETHQDNIAVVEVMTERLDAEFWCSVRKRIELELSQKEIVIRAHGIVVFIMGAALDSSGSLFGEPDVPQPNSS
jgi:hypothetical protein